jgi:hypothetical protein
MSFLNREEWTLVGHIGVDAGLCWIGDPCYILHTSEYKDGKEVPTPLPESLGKDWADFCNLLGESYPTMKSFPYAKGHEGLGVCVSTGFGDGSYPVYARITNEGTWGKRVTAVFVDFLGNAFGDEDEEGEDEEETCIECGSILDERGNCENTDCRECPDYDDSDEDGDDGDEKEEETRC